MIRAFIFDLSNVCFDLEEPPFLEEFVLKHNVPREKFLNRYQELLEKAEINEMSGEALWQTLLAEYSVDDSPVRIISDMMARKNAYPETLALVEKLSKKYTVVFLTNYNKDYWEHIKRRFDLKTYFAWGVVSYQIGARKPSLESFQAVLKKLGCKPEEVVYTDDSAKNLQNAHTLGIHTFQFKDVPSLVLDLRTVGIDV